MQETVTVTAEVLAVHWRANDGAFAVLGALDEEGDEITITGPIAHLREGERIIVQGEWRDHPRFGRQLHCEHVRVGPAMSLLTLLSSVKHVGPEGARWLIDRHGSEVLEIVDRDPGARLREVPGIGRTRLRSAIASWQRHAGGRALQFMLEERGVPATVCARVHRELGGDALALLREHPYALARIEGIGFATADTIAQAIGLDAAAPVRIDAGLQQVLRASERDGHCYLSRPALIERSARLLRLPHQVFAERIDEAADLVIDGERVLEARMDYMERRLAERVRELVDAPAMLDLHVPSRPPKGDQAPTATQWNAVRTAAEHRLSILTGLPGTGKTTTMRALVQLLASRELSVRLCAPTGKAARRLSEATGAEATTIHRLLEYIPGEGFTRDAEDPLTDVDLLVVDEASMLDVRLAEALLSAISERTHVLLVGDIDQLAPVGPGRVLEDLITSGAVPSTHLTEVFRQAARSLIIQAAHAINRGNRPPTSAAADDVRDFFLVERNHPSEIFEETVSLAVNRLAAHYRLDPVADVQVLVPMHRGQVGSISLNTTIRERLNPDGEPVPGTRFRIGDRVMQTRNNHDRSFYNGEIGVIVAANRTRGTLTIACDDGRRLTLDVPEAIALRLAYACSVHKMQGSQAPAVIIALTRAHAPMLTRNLLYTAVTRSQSACVIVGERGAMEIALGRVGALRRNTRLVELLSG